MREMSWARGGRAQGFEPTETLERLASWDTVTVSADTKRSKVSVGSNPWARPPRAHDISRICERYGGGGHPVVGAVSLGPDRVEDVRRIAREIVATLQAPPAAQA